MTGTNRPMNTLCRRCVVVVMFSASVFASIAQYLGQHRLPVCVVGCCVVCCVCVLCVCVVCPWFLSVAIAVGSRPVPFRTRKLSPPAPMVLHLGGCGRVGHCRPITCVREFPSSLLALLWGWWWRGRLPLFCLGDHPVLRRVKNRPGFGYRRHRSSSLSRHDGGARCL